MSQKNNGKKKKVLNEYHKLLKKDKHNLNEWSNKLKKIYESEGYTISEIKKKKNDKTKASVYHNEIKSFQKKQIEKQRKQEEYLRRKQEKEIALNQYHAKQKKKRKMLYKKNYKGQPNMEVRMQLLLEKIEKSSKTD